METKVKNLRISTSRFREDGFDIYLDFSGRREYLYQNRPNKMLYQILKSHPYVSDLRRMQMAGKFFTTSCCPAEYRPRLTRNRRMKNDRLDNSISHVIQMVDCFVDQHE